MLDKTIRWLAAILFYLLALFAVREGYMYLYPGGDGYAEDYQPLTESQADSALRSESRLAGNPAQETDYGPEQYDRVYAEIEPLAVEGRKPKGKVGPIEWKDLEDVTYERRWYEQFASEIPMPKFGPKTARLDGMAVEMTGFLIPESHTNTIDALSKFSYEQCFFCTGGSRASVAHVMFEESPDLPLNALVTVRGTLWLNENDPNSLDIVLADAELVRVER